MRTPREVADKFARDSLKISDGSAKAGIARIGRQQFDRTVDRLVEILLQMGDEMTQGVRK